MRIPARRRKPTRPNGGRLLTASCLLTLASLAPVAQASFFTPKPVSEPSLDISQLGRIGITGSFSGLSFYEFEGQTEELPSTNGADSLMTLLPNGLFYDIAALDATVQAMCVFGDSIIIGGNFTSVNGTESTAVAAMDIATGSLSPLAGISGEVSSLYCDNDAGKVYVGGSFKAADSTNAITWVSSGNWASLPFAGFNGPVSSITKAANGHIIFGGQFTGLGNVTTTTNAESQPLNIGAAVVEGFQSSTAPGFSNASNVVCNVNGDTGPGHSWLLLDGTPGAWRAEFGFKFAPTKLRLRNTRQPNRGTKTWSLTALPLNGLMNFTYVDPTTGQNRSCTNECPLSNDADIEFQEFHFVNSIQMNAVRLDISEYYGKGGGLDGVDFFQDAVLAFAIEDFNTPSCSNTTAPAKATTTGPWKETVSGQSSSKYLSATIQTPIESDDATVIFYPPVQEAGTYSFNMYTPGCIVDNTCQNRGQVEIISHLSPDEDPQRVVIYQSNYYDKFDPIASGLTTPISDSFQPSITLRPIAGQDLPQGATSMVMVAQAVALWLTESSDTNTTSGDTSSSSTGLNGLFEYDPSQATINQDDFDKSEFIQLGSTFAKNSIVSALVTSGELTFIGGNFTSDQVSHIAAISSGETDPITVDGGLDGAVTSLYLASDGKLFVGGDFKGTQDGTVSNLNHVGVYDSAATTWSALGAGVDGLVKNIVPMFMNMSGISENVITLNGDFKTILAFGDNSAVSTDGFAVWVPSLKRWLENDKSSVPMFEGLLSASLLDLGDGTSLYAGSLSAQALSANGAATMTDSLGNFPVTIKTESAASSSSKTQSVKRAPVVDSLDSIYGVVAGLFYKNDQGGNITVLAGHFTAEATDDTTIHNLILMDGADSDAVAGLPAGVTDASVFLAVATQGDNLFAGGRINGTVSGSTVSGLVSYNLAGKSFNKQPPALAGDDVVVSSILLQPDTSDVYVGGTFNSAGSLPCPGVCVFSTSTNQWTRPGVELDGTVYSMIWSSNTVLVAGGEFNISGSSTFLASYDATASTWTAFNGASAIPGPVDTLTIATADGAQLWVAGTSSGDKSPYLMKYDGQSWETPAVTFESDTTIQSLQMYTLSEGHDDAATMPGNQILMLTGSIGIPGFGTASVAIFDGTTLHPFILATSADGSAGSIAKIFVENPTKFFTTSEGGMALGFIVLIALAISLGLMLIIVVAGLALDRYRKKREGYMPAPTSMIDRSSGMQRVPPRELLDSLHTGGAPRV